MEYTRILRFVRGGTTYRKIRDKTMLKKRGGCGPPKIFFKILNNRYIFKILENKFMKNYICPSQENYIFSPRFRILVLSLRKITHTRKSHDTRNYVIQ